MVQEGDLDSKRTVIVNADSSSEEEEGVMLLMSRDVVLGFQFRRITCRGGLEDLGLAVWVWCGLHRDNDKAVSNL